MNYPFRHAVFIYPYKKPEKFNYFDLFPPVGVEHIATAVKPFVEKIVILDQRYESSPMESYFPGADIVGLSVKWEHQMPFAAEILEKIPKGVFVMMGGIYATDKAEELLKKYPRIDLIVKGEGEQAAQDLFSGKKLKDIRSIVYRSGKTIKTSPGQVFSKKLDIYPDRTLRKYKYVHQAPFGVSVGLDTIMTSRGCNFSCEFCTHRFDAEGNLRKWSYRDPENVVDEIQAIEAKIIVVSDDDFTVNKQRLEQICDLIVRRRIKKIFIVESRIEIGNHPQLLKKMWKAGFRFIAYGIESAQDKTLKRIGKGFTKKKAVEAFKNINKYPMLSSGYFIIGYINESREDMLEISRFARQLGLDFITHSKLRALENSPLRETVMKMPNYHINENGRVYSDDISRDDLGKITKAVLREFFTPRQYMHIVYKILRSGILFRPAFLKALWIAIAGGVISKKMKRNLLVLR